MFPYCTCRWKSERADGSHQIVLGKWCVLPCDGVARPSQLWGHRGEVQLFFKNSHESWSAQEKGQEIDVIFRDLM